MGLLQLRLVQSNKPEQTFDRAWVPFPRKEAKKDGRKAWADLNADEAQVEMIIEAINRWAHQWLVVEGRETRFIPLFATWIRGERWDDQIPTPPKPKMPTLDQLPEWQRRSIQHATQRRED